MAGVYSKSGQDVQAQLMTCCLGDHPLQTPKRLPCQHSFCTGCIKAKVSHDRKQFTCPKCQLSILLTIEGVDQLPDNFLYHTLGESENKYSECVICKFDDKKTPGTFQCLDCADVLCDECKVGHTKTSLSRSHRLVPVKDVQDGKYKSELQAAKTLLCPTHSGPYSPMVLQLYCEDCECLACQICDLTEHQPKGHTCKTTNEIHEEKTGAITELVTKLLNLIQLDKEFAALLEQGQCQLKVLQEKLENEIHERAAFIIDVIEKVKQDKLTEVKGHFQTEQTTIKTRLDETKNRMIRTDSIVSYTQAFLEHSAKSEFLKNENEIMKMIANQMQQKIDRRFQVKPLELTEPDMEQIEAFISNVFGKCILEIQKLDLSTKKAEQYEEKSASSTRKFLAHSSKSDQIQQKSDKSSQTELLGKTELTAKGGRKHRVRGLKSKGTRNKESQRQLLAFTRSIFCENIGRYDVQSLTVTENHDIVAVSEKTILVYNRDGQYKDSAECGQLQTAQSVVFKGDTLYVLENSNLSENPKLLLMDLKGNVKKIISLSIPSCGHTDEQLLTGLAVDHEGTVYVSDNCLDQIYKCEPAATELTVFMQRDTYPDLYKPKYLSVTSGGDLVVSNCGSDTVQVYDRLGQLLWQYKSYSGLGDVCCDKEGYIYFVDGNKYVQVIKNGQLTGSVYLMDSPDCIALDNYNNIVCTLKGLPTSRVVYTELTKIKLWE